MKKFLGVLLLVGSAVSVSAHAEQELSCGHIIQGTSGTTGCIWVEKNQADNNTAAPAVKVSKIFKIFKFVSVDENGKKQVCTDEVIQGTSGTTRYTCRDL